MSGSINKTLNTSFVYKMSKAPERLLVGWIWSLIYNKFPPKSLIFIFSCLKGSVISLRFSQPNHYHALVGSLHDY